MNRSHDFSLEHSNDVLIYVKSQLQLAQNLSTTSWLRVLSTMNHIITDICDPGWSYFQGFCYFTSDRCANWTSALAKCRHMNSVLVDVNSNEENVYIQHRHNGKKSWLGFNDVLSEGVFTWADLGAGNFTAWAKDQPNNLDNQDCVRTLGLKHNYEWNDISCDNCDQYTCKKGKS